MSAGKTSRLTGISEKPWKGASAEVRGVLGSETAGCGGPSLGGPVWGAGGGCNSWPPGVVPAANPGAGAWSRARGGDAGTQEGAGAVAG